MDSLARAASLRLARRSCSTMEPATATLYLKYVGNQGGSDLGQLALLRPRPLSARSCLRLPRASAGPGQPAAWAALGPAGHSGLGFHIALDEARRSDDMVTT